MKTIEDTMITAIQYPRNPYKFLVPWGSKAENIEEYMTGLVSGFFPRGKPAMKSIIWVFEILNGVSDLHSVFENFILNEHSNLNSYTTLDKKETKAVDLCVAISQYDLRKLFLSKAKLCYPQPDVVIAFWIIWQIIYRIHPFLSNHMLPNCDITGFCDLEDPTVKQCEKTHLVRITEFNQEAVRPELTWKNIQAVTNIRTDDIVRRKTPTPKEMQLMQESWISTDMTIS